MSKKAYTKENPPSLDEVSIWLNSDKLINPRTQKIIDSKKKSFKALNKAYTLYLRQDKITEDGTVKMIKVDPSQIDPKNLYRDEFGYPIKFNPATLKKYVGIRKAKIDPILYINVDEEIAVKVDMMWDPYNNGKILKKDPFGAIYMHPACIVKILLSRLLKDLWTPSHDEGVGGDYIEGHHGDCLGAGDDEFTIRGHKRPECYVFRYPFEDLYLPEKYNYQVHVVTPKFIYSDIVDIYKKALKCKEEFVSIAQYPCPDLLKIWKFYHLAIAKYPKFCLKRYIDEYINLKMITEEHNKYNEYKKYYDYVMTHRDKILDNDEMIKLFDNDILYEVNPRGMPDSHKMAEDLTKELFSRSNIDAVEVLKEMIGVYNE